MLTADANAAAAVTGKCAKDKIAKKNPIKNPHSSFKVQ